ncbi:energy transducer TonB family protein [Mesorhizobium amorphae]
MQRRINKLDPFFSVHGERAFHPRTEPVNALRVVLCKYGHVVHGGYYLSRNIASVAALMFSLSLPAFAVEAKAIDLKFTPPNGLCQIDPSRSKADRQIWTTLPDPKTAQLTHTTFIDCLALEQARKGDFLGKPPTNVIFLAELPRTKDQTPPIPFNLKDLVAVLVGRDAPRYDDAKVFFGKPKETAFALLGSDANGVYYGVRKFDETGKEVGGGFSVYTMIESTPLLVWVLHYETTIDEVKYQAVRQLIARMQDENSSPVTVNMDGMRGLAKKVESCLNLAAGEVAGKAVVSFRINEDGTLQGKPVVVEQSEDPASEAIGQAAVLALLKCQPYSEFGLQGQFHLPFVFK